ncbi:MAG: hypothetical protein JXA14_13660 [Anaerolineae bacterium]|nr:hypothetical protein [Anaerolineae bacterium]
MIDDYEQAMELLHEMEEQLPIQARPTSTMIRGLRIQGHRIARDQKLVIQSVFYAGDEAGIVCAPEPLEGIKVALVISVTHLQIDLRHPLAKKIRAYQQERKRRLAQAGGSREPSSITLYPRKEKRRR